MPKKSWVIWLLVWIGIAAVGGCIGGLLLAQGAPTAGWSVIGATFFIWTLWLTRGFVTWWQLRWVKWAAVVIGGTYLVTGLFILCVWQYWTGTAIAVAGIWAMALTFFLGLFFIRLILSPGWPVLGVARTLVDEAIRMKVALIFIVALVIIVPILPFIMDPNERLQYRIQSFLSYSMTVSGVLLSLMTVFLACGTITSEVKNRQIFMTMSKPIGRGQYLFGKWLGIVLLNMVLLSVTGGAMYMFTRLLERQPAREEADFFAVREQVLTARETTRPVTPPGMDMHDLFIKRFKQLYAEDSSSYGGPGLDMSKPDVLQKALDDMTDAQRNAISAAVVAAWQSIGPHDAGVYRFTGLGPAKELLGNDGAVQLRYKVNLTPWPADERVHMWMKINGRPYPVYDGYQRPIIVPPTSFQVMYIPAQFIDADGNLDIEIHNEDLIDPANTFPASITFEPGEGLEVLYRIGSFEGNLARSLGIIWVKLAFLAILGLAAGTFLGFPVACLLSFMVFAGSVSKGFMDESLSSYSTWAPKTESIWAQIVWFISNIVGGIASGHFWDVCKLIIRTCGEVFMACVPSFSQFDPVPLLSDGRLVSNDMLIQAVLWVGVISAGLCGLCGWFIFRRRELARVTV